VGVDKLDWEIDFRGRAMHVPARRNSAIQDKAFYFINQSGHRCFYAALEKGEIEPLTKLSSLNYEYIENKKLLEVVCADPSFHETFEILFMESFELMAEEGFSFPEAYEKTIEKYRAFLQSEVFLSPIKQIGLLNELLFLKDILQKDQTGLKYWRDMDEDFQFGNIFVELKATRSKIHKHIINGLPQLSVPPETTKYLVTSLVIDLGERKTPESNNLYEITVDLFGIVPKDQKRGLLDRLADRGYFHEVNGPEYGSFNYQYYDWLFIEVDDSFPCINLSSFDGSLYNYVDPKKVQYELDLSGLSGSLKEVEEGYILKLLDGRTH